MPKKPEQLERELLKAGFILQKGKGKGGHRRYLHPDGRTTEIPFHSKECKRRIVRYSLSERQIDNHR